MGAFTKCEEVKEFGNIVPPGLVVSDDEAEATCPLTTHLTEESPDSSLKDALRAALSFWITVRSSFKVFALRTPLMNCLTVGKIGEPNFKTEVELEQLGLRDVMTAI